TSSFFEDTPHLAKARLVGQDDVIGQDDSEGLLADGIARDENRVSEAQRFFLADRDEVDHPRYRLDLGEQIELLTVAQRSLQLGRVVEVVQDRILPLRSDDDQL